MGGERLARDVGGERAGDAAKQMQSRRTLAQKPQVLLARTSARELRLQRSTGGDDKVEAPKPEEVEIASGSRRRKATKGPENAAPTDGPKDGEGEGKLKGERAKRDLKASQAEEPPAKKQKDAHEKESKKRKAVEPEPEGSVDEATLKKQRQGRKSSAYHAAKSKAIEDGKSIEEAKEAGKKGTRLCIVRGP